MKLTETHFVRGRPVGLIVMDSRSCMVDHISKDKTKRPAGGPWASVDELKAALRELHGSTVERAGTG